MLKIARGFNRGKRYELGVIYIVYPWLNPRDMFEIKTSQKIGIREIRELLRLFAIARVVAKNNFR